MKTGSLSSDSWSGHVCNIQQGDKFIYILKQITIFCSCLCKCNVCLGKSCWNWQLLMVAIKSLIAGSSIKWSSLHKFTHTCMLLVSSFLPSFTPPMPYTSLLPFLPSPALIFLPSLMIPLYLPPRISTVISVASQHPNFLHLQKEPSSTKSLKQ